MHHIALNLSCYIMRKKGSEVSLSQESRASGGSKLEGESFRGALF